MTFGQFITLLRSRYIIIASTAIVGLVAGCAIFALSPTRYTAQTTLYVSAQFDGNPTQAFQGAQLSELRVKSYTELATSDRVLEIAASRLPEPYPIQQLRESVTARSNADSVLIQISATNTASETAKLIADAVAAATSETVAELERPQLDGATAPVAARIVQQAAIPTDPSSPSITTLAAIGLALGLLCGCAGAWIRHTTDQTVSSGEQLAVLLGTANLGQTEILKDAADRLPVSSSPQGIEAESYRVLRTNLGYVDVDREQKVIAFTSPGPSEGKTTTVANLAIALGFTGTPVLAIEADMRRPQLGETLGLEKSVGLTDFLTGRLNIEQATQKWAGGTLDVICCGRIPPNPSELMSSLRMKHLLDEARKRYSIVLIDCPPVLPVTDAAALASSVDGVVIVCKSGRTRLQQLYEAKRAVETASGRLVGTILTMAKRRENAPYYSIPHHNGSELRQTFDWPNSAR